MEYDSAKEQLDKGNIAQLYLLTGDEPLLMEDIIETLKSALVTSESMESLLLLTYDPKVQVPDAAVAEIRSGAFFDMRKLCVIKNLVAGDEDSQPWVAALKQYAKSPNPGAVVVVAASGDARAIKPLRTAFEESGVSIECGRYRGGSKNRAWVRWVTSYVAGKGKKLSGQAQWALGTISGPSLGVLRNELDKVISYVGERDTIETSDITAVCSDAAEISAFEVTDSVTTGDARTAMQKLDRVLRRGEQPNRFMGLLMQTIRNVARAKALLSTMSRAKAMEALGVHQFVASKSVAAAGRISDAGLESAYEMLLDADLALKTGKDAALTLEALVLDLSGLFTGKT